MLTPRTIDYSRKSKRPVPNITVLGIIAPYQKTVGNLMIVVRGHYNSSLLVFRLTRMKYKCRDKKGPNMDP